jgi:hypothetical protein
MATSSYDRVFGRRSSEAQSRPDGGDDLLGAPQDVRGGEAQHRPSAEDQTVLPPDVLDENAPFTVDVAIELHEHPPIGSRQVDPPDESAIGVPDDVLQNGGGKTSRMDQPAEH